MQNYLHKLYNIFFLFSRCSLIFFQQFLEQQQRNEEAGELTELVRDFLDPSVFYQQLKKKDIDFFCGVPDSLLKGTLKMFQNFEHFFLSAVK